MRDGSPPRPAPARVGAAAGAGRPPPARLRARLAEAGLGPADPADFAPLPGGLTNRVWRWRRATGDVAVKLVRPEAATPLFPNEVSLEHAALRALAGTGLAPAPVALLPGAEPVLVTGFAGTGPGDPGTAGRLLARLHGLAPPAFLPHRTGGAPAILAAGEALLAGLPGAAALRALRPAAADLPEAPPAFLHGDPVPANLVAGPGGPVLVDWQCPAAGDPVEDLACFLSPAMQIAYGSGPLPPAAQAAFLAAYAQPRVADRLARLRPALHWRMACYCLWLVAHRPARAAAARAGLAAELAALQSCASA